MDGLEIIKRNKRSVNIRWMGKAFTVNQWLAWLVKGDNGLWYPAACNFAPDGLTMTAQHELAQGLSVGSEWTGREVRYWFK